MVTSWSLLSKKAIYLMWADFGAGKTHALRYLEYMASQQKPPGVSIYADLTRAPDSFLDIYTRVVPRIPEAALRDSIFEFRQRHPDWLDRPELQGDRDTAQVLWSLRESPAGVQGQYARSWLRGGSMPRTQLEAIGASRPLRKSEDALRALTSIVAILATSGLYSRILFMLDEFQRVGEVASRKIHDINASLKALYDNAPSRLTMILTYSMGDPTNINFMTSDDLRDRVSDQFSLPALTRDESVVFLHDLLTHYRLGSAPLALTRGAMELIVDEIAGNKLTPRRIMQRAGDAATKALIEGVPFPLDVAQVRKLPRHPQPDR
jgi:hypothetical protein